jgi:hypothetical protein
MTGVADGLVVAINGLLRVDAPLTEPTYNRARLTASPGGRGF